MLTSYQPYNTRYQLARYELADGSYLTASLPAEVRGHFGVNLRGLILYQYHQCHVTQPLLLEELWEWGIDLSAGQLNAILTEGHGDFILGWVHTDLWKRYVYL